MIDSWWTAVLSFRVKHWQPVGEERAAMFKQISMKNFKSWRDTGPVRMAPLTGFFGANSSGKSSLLQMLLLLKQTAESNDRNLVLKTGSLQEGYVNLGTAHEITFFDSTDMMLSVEWDLPAKSSFNVPVPHTSESVRIEQLAFDTVIHVGQQRIHVDKLRYRSGDRFSVELSRKPNNHYTIRIEVDGKPPVRAQGRPRVYMKPEKCYSFSDEAMRYYQDTSYLSDLALQFERRFQQLYYLGPLREYPQRTYTWAGENPVDVGLKGELAVPALLGGRNRKVYPDGRKRYSKLEERVAQWLVELDLAHSFETRPLYRGSSEYSVWLKRHKRSAEVRITDMGIGVSQVLPVLVLCYYAPAGSTIILEQPELHLHPSVQAGLADVFIDAIRNRNVQIILESHSEHMLRRLQRRIAEAKFNREEAALYFCEMSEGVSQITDLNVDLFGHIHNWPDDFFGDLLGEMVGAFDARLERTQIQVNAS